MIRKARLFSGTKTDMGIGMTSDTELQQKIYMTQVDKAYTSLPSGLIVNIVNAFVLVYVQWNVIAPANLVIWASSLILISLMRLGCHLYRKNKAHATSKKWGNLYIAGLFLSGLVWGSAGILLFPETDIAHQLIVAFVLGGMLAGATVSSAALPGAYYYYCIPVISPILFMYFQLNDPVGNAMSFMILIFAAFSITTYRHTHRMIVDLITSQINNEQESKARRYAESKTKEHQEFLEAVLYNIEDGVVACDENGILSLFNRATREFHDIPEAPLVPEEWSDHYDLYMEDGITPMKHEDIPLYKALQGEQVCKQEMCIIPKGGKKKNLIASGQPLFGGDGKKIGAVISMHDITREKKARIALEKAYDDLERKINERTEELVEVNRNLRIEVEERRKTETENKDLIHRLQEALSKVKTLSGFLPICASCKKIRDDKGYWNQIEIYIQEHSEAEFSHGLCPDCVKKLYPEGYIDMYGKGKEPTG